MHSYISSVIISIALYYNLTLDVLMAIKLLLTITLLEKVSVKDIDQI